MAITNYDRVGKSLELLRDGMRPFIERELSAKYGKYWITKSTEGWQNELTWPDGAGWISLAWTACERGNAPMPKTMRIHQPRKRWKRMRSL